MADIDLVIKIDEEIYQEAIKSGYSHSYDEDVANAIANGTPLPKRHGRIIDESKITKCQQVGLIIEDDSITRCLITDAPTIIKSR